MEDLTGLTKRTHKLVLNNRRTCNLTGVIEVISFDENNIVLETDQGMLQLKGKELHVNRLTLEKGEVDIDGRVDSLIYSDQGSKNSKNESLLVRLFK